jgi:hypothetical protein
MPTACACNADTFAFSLLAMLRACFRHRRNINGVWHRATFPD